MSWYIQKSILPFAFIFLYGSGFIFTQYGLQNSSPMAFLGIRFFIAFWILLIIAYVLKVPIPKSKKEFFQIAFAGSLTVGTFSIGVFLSISYGVSGALNALIIALQPIVVTFLALKFLNEEINKRIWLGLIMGFIGVEFVVISKLDTSYDSIVGIFWSIVGLLGLSFGSLYQKKYCTGMNLYSGGAIQTLSSTILVVPFLFFEDIQIIWNTDFIIALLYMSVGVSIGALSLLYIMIKNGEVSKVSSIFYLVPVSAAIVSYFLLGETMQWNVIVGIVTVLIGITLINKKEKK
ncbi:DMT family transporter [Arcobacter sp. s6]|uniref:DMT family transporter n=1 Tax=Arcobacter sp. s6 TaxID=3230363 RepID=UPI0034A05AF2